MVINLGLLIHHSLPRPYCPRGEAALEEIIRARGTYYDAQVVDACVALFREKQYVIPK